jgi:hypothetical protein
MNKKINVVIIGFIVLALLSSACSGDNLSSSTEEKSEDFSQSYPAPQTKINQNEEIDYEDSYPTKTEQTLNNINELVIPTANADSGVIFGTIQSLPEKSPLGYSTIYLASKIVYGSEEDYILSFEEHSSPHTQSIATGEFVISNIPPGEYLLVLETPINTFPIINQSGDHMDISITGGDHLDLGMLYANYPNFDIE